MACQFKLTRHVEFSETDMAGIMHFSNFFRYMEAAEHAFFRSLGLSIFETKPEGFGWPRVHAECDYKRPLRFEDSVEIELLVKEKRTKTLVYQFVFRRARTEEPEEVARGVLIVACVESDKTTGKMRGVPIPAGIASLIDVAPQELLER